MNLEDASTPPAGEPMRVRAVRLALQHWPLIDVGEGAGNLLASDRPPLLMFEVGDSLAAAFGTSSAAVEGRLAAHGYGCYRYRNARLETVDVDEKHAVSEALIALHPCHLTEYPGRGCRLTSRVSSMPSGFTLSLLRRPNGGPAAARNRGFRAARRHFVVLLVGSVYAAQADAVRSVALAVGQLPIDAALTLYTDQSAEELAGLGISGPRVTIRPTVPASQLPAILRAADALLVALAFEPAQQTVVRTSFPTKTIDYLAAGVPIVVQAPSQAAVCVRARAEGWGFVIDVPGPQGVAEGLQRLAGDVALQQGLARAALDTAARQHSLENRRAEFVAGIRRAAS